MKIIIEAITGWEEDEDKIAEDRVHGGLSESDVLLSLAGETKDKKESEWTKGLPFVWEHDVKLDVSADVNVGRCIYSYLDDVLAEYTDQYCADDYLKPTRFEGRIVA